MRRYFNQGTQKPQTRKAGAGIGALGGSKKKEKTLGQKQFDTYMAEKDTGFKKAQRIQKTYEGASPKIKADLEKRFKKVFDPKEMVVSSRRDTAKTQNMAKGGRVGYKKGSDFPDLNKDGKITKADILMGRGVIGKKKTKKKKMKAYKSPMQKQVRKS